MPSRFAVRPVIILLAALMVAAAFFAAPGLCAEKAPFSLETQEKWLWESIEEAILEMHQSPAELKKTLEHLRGTGGGSWLNNTTGKGSDIDFTLGSSDPKLEEELTRRVRQGIERRYEAALKKAARQGRFKHLSVPKGPDVKVVHSRVRDWDELFTGPTGQRFFLDYANRTGGGVACFKWEPVLDAKGRVVGLKRMREVTEEFWRVTQGKVPKYLTNPSKFVDESLAMLAKAGKGSVDARARAAAKYLNNTQEWLVPGLEKQWGARLNQLRADPNQRQFAKFLLDIKKKPLAEQKELLKIHFGVKTDEEVGRKLAQFADRVESHLARMSDDMKYLGQLSRSGRLQRLGGPARALGLRKALMEAFASATGRVMLAADVVGIILAYQDGGPGAAALETASVAASMAVPPAAIAALVADVGRQVFKAAATWAINAAIFDPINDMAIRKFYQPGSSCYLFRNGTIPFASPFRGLTRETIAYKFSSQAQIRAATNRFLHAAKGAGCAWFATAGEGDITGRLFGRLYRDFLVSQEIAAKVQELALKARAGEYLPPLHAFRVLVNGRLVSPTSAGGRHGQARFLQKVAPGQGAEFKIKIAREYGMWQGLDPKAESLYKVWGQHGGYAAMRRYAEKHTLRQYLTGAAPSLVAVSWKAPPGWRLAGERPGTREFYLSNPQRVQWRYFTRTVAITPGQGAKGRAQADLTLTLVSDTPGVAPQTYKLVLAAELAGQAQKPAPPAKPYRTDARVGLSADKTSRPLEGKVVVSAVVSGGKGPFTLHLRIKTPGGKVFKEASATLKGRKARITWGSRVPKPGVYRILAYVDDAAGGSSLWSRPLAITVTGEKKPEPAPLVAPKPEPKPRPRRVPCGKYTTLKTFTGKSPKKGPVFTDTRHAPPTAEYGVDLPGPGTLRITVTCWGKHRFANHEYGACRGRARAVLSSSPEVGLNGHWVAGGRYFPGVVDRGRNSYSWKVKAGGRVGIKFTPEWCRYEEIRSGNKKVRRCACTLSDGVGYSTFSHSYQIKVEFKPSCK